MHALLSPGWMGSSSGPHSIRMGRADCSPATNSWVSTAPLTSLQPHPWVGVIFWRCSGAFWGARWASSCCYPHIPSYTLLVTPDLTRGWTESHSLGCQNVLMNPLASVPGIINEKAIYPPCTATSELLVHFLHHLECIEAWDSI